jgi:hypothetical protein
MLSRGKPRAASSASLISLISLALTIALLTAGCSDQGKEAGAQSIVPCSTQAKIQIKEITQIQLLAFQGERVSDAYQYFSENFQSDIDKETFAIIAGSNYPMLINSTSIAFGECRAISPGYAQAVVVKADGASHKLLYFFTGEGDVGDGESESLKIEGITVED